MAPQSLVYVFPFDVGQSRVAPKPLAGAQVHWYAVPLIEVVTVTVRAAEGVPVVLEATDVEELTDELGRAPINLPPMMLASCLMLPIAFFK